MHFQIYICMASFPSLGEVINSWNANNLAVYDLLFSVIRLTIDLSFQVFILNSDLFARRLASFGWDRNSQWLDNTFRSTPHSIRGHPHQRNSTLLHHRTPFANETQIRGLGHVFCVALHFHYWEIEFCRRLQFDFLDRHRFLHWHYQIRYMCTGGMYSREHELICCD